MEREQALERREAWLAQQDRGKALFHEWRSAVSRRLDSDDAYARFEKVHQRYWDFFRHIGMPSTELSLALQRHRDGKPVNPEPLVEELEHQPHFHPRIAHVLKQLARTGALSHEQERRVVRVLLHHLAFPGWHRNLRDLTRLACALDPTLLHEALQNLPDSPPRAYLLRQLEQDAKMRLSAKNTSFYMQ